MNRRTFMAISGLSGVGSGLNPRCLLGSNPTTSPDEAAEDLLTPATHRAIDRGLAYLASRQNDDGSFGMGSYSRNVALCGLTGMTFLAGGNTPGRGRYGRHVSRCVELVLANAQESGFVQAPEFSSHGPMYGHGFATLFLAEVYGMSSHYQLREKLGRAVRLIVSTQNDKGGWRYQPQRRDADLSVTVCQIMALRAARNAGLYVPNETVQRCIGYVRRAQNADGGFMYMASGGPSAFPRSAAGVVALYSAGIYKGAEVDRGLKYLMTHLPQAGNVQQRSHFYYGHYYAVQAMWHAGGDYWRRWYPAVRDLLLSLQQEDGHWFDSIGPNYGTAMATLILQMPHNHLPIFQK